MRTNIVVDDELMKAALAATGLRTKKDVVQLALAELVRSRRRKNLADLAGRIRFARDFDHKVQRELRRGDR
jgi:Arc/MetJ family transcription regulator